MYTPNFNDPRVQKRIRKALGYIIGNFSAEKEVSGHCRTMDKFIGKQNNPLSAYIRSSTLIVCDEHYDSYTGKCKTYRMNADGVTNLKADIDCHESEYELVLAYVADAYGDQLRKKSFDYKDKSYRRWNGIQNIRNVFRKDILKHYGFKCDYDISTAAQTILYQHSVMLGNVQPMPAIENYLKNKSNIRQKLATVAGVEETVIKRAITAITAGAPIREDDKSALFKIFNLDADAFNAFKNDIFTKLYIQDLAVIWKHIRPTITTDGRLKAKDKWLIYFREERKIMDVVTAYLEDNGIFYFLEHDGFVTDREVNMQELQADIKKKTRYRISFDREVAH